MKKEIHDKKNLPEVKFSWKHAGYENVSTELDAEAITVHYGDASFPLAYLMRRLFDKLEESPEPVYRG